MNQSSRASVTRHRLGQPSSTADDALADEEPLEIRVEGRSVALTMRTPGHDEELAMGFLATEGVLRGPDDVLDLDICSARDGGPGNVINVRLRDPRSVDLDQLSRHVFTSSSCGLCGKATIDSMRDQHDSIPRGQTQSPTLPTLLGLPSKLHAAQTTFHATGGLHAAALFDRAGNLIVVREDVGRHNAVDKVLGRLLLDRGDAAKLGLLVSGRIAFEIAQKALSARVGLIAGISAPTSLAVDLARTSGQTLIGFLRNDRCNVYAGELSEG
jgi:FdhD protein